MSFHISVSQSSDKHPEVNSGVVGSSVNFLRNLCMFTTMAAPCASLPEARGPLGHEHEKCTQKLHRLAVQASQERPVCEKEGDSSARKFLLLSKPIF